MMGTRAILGKIWPFISQPCALRKLPHDLQHIPIRALTSQSSDAAFNTVSSKEVNKFSSWSDKWWHINGDFAALHSMNELRVPLIVDALVDQDSDYNPSKPLKGVSLLDVGCGAGILSEPLARLGAHVSGIDASSEAIDSACWHASYDPDVLSNTQYMCCAVEDLLARTDKGDKYDAVIASEIVEHVAQPSTFVSACCKLIKPGGSLFITTINRTFLAYTIAVIGAERLAKVSPVGAHEWNKLVAPNELQEMLKNNEMTTVLTHGMTMNPVNLKWCWISSTSVNYAVHAIKPKGN